MTTKDEKNSIKVSCRGVLKLARHKVPVTITGADCNGLPLLLQVRGDPEIVRRAVKLPTVDLEAFNKRFQLDVINHQLEPDLLLVRAGAFFESLTEDLQMTEHRRG